MFRIAQWCPLQRLSASLGARCFWFNYQVSKERREFALIAQLLSRSSSESFKPCAHFQYRQRLWTVLAEEMRLVQRLKLADFWLIVALDYNVCVFCWFLFEFSSTYILYVCVECPFIRYIYLSFGNWHLNHKMIHFYGDAAYPSNIQVNWIIK